MSECAYCGTARAVNKDHVVHRFRFKKDVRLAEKLGFDVNDPCNVVLACFACNNRRGTRKLLPPSMASRANWLNTKFGGARWQVWRGGNLPAVKR